MAILKTISIIFLKRYNVCFLISPKRRNIQLSIVKVNETNIPPRENVSYSKETQTINPEPIEKDGKFILSNFIFYPKSKTYN